MRWTEEQYEEYLRAKSKNSATYPADYVEQTIGDAPLGAEEIPGLDTPCCICVRSFRHRLADSDGISGKAVIDGLVHAGILPDDSPKFVEEVTYRQTKIKSEAEEVTEITLSW